MYIGSPHGSSGVLHPNQNLDPETSHNWEIGARYDNGNFDADVAMYYSLASDYIYNEKLGNGTDDTMYKNADEAKTFGVEVSLAYTIDSLNLTPYASGAYMHREYETSAYKTSQTGDPRWTGRTGVRYEKEVSEKFSWHADAYARFASTSKQLDSEYAVTHNGGYTTYNFAIGAKFGEDRNMFADINFNNITDKRYSPGSSSLEDPGMNVVVRTGIEF